MEKTPLSNVEAADLDLGGRGGASLPFLSQAGSEPSHDPQDKVQRVSTSSLSHYLRLWKHLGERIHLHRIHLREFRKYTFQESKLPDSVSEDPEGISRIDIFM